MTSSTGATARRASGSAAEDVARAPDPLGLCHARTDVTEHDHQRLLEPIAAGRVPHDPEG